MTGDGSPYAALSEARALNPVLDDRVAANKRRAAALVAVFVASLSAALWLVTVVLGEPVLGLAVALLIACLAAAAVYAGSEALVLTLMGAHPADPVDHARLHNLVEGLCFASGLPKPRVCVVEDKALNAFAAGRSPRRAAVGVTTGLLATLSRVELEAVLAHELTHVKSWDVLVSTMAAALVGFPASFLPAPTVNGLVDMAIGDGATGQRRESEADLGGVAVTRYPPGMISAMEKLHDDPAALGSGSRATAHLWMAPPVPGGEGSASERLDERIEALREL
ncbi:MAG: M48 family metalloprotease [Actinomycetota bacterium]|nr:M48 family metalloprotease [Actinomycetota bacterium]MDQ3679117.1 M48 family metalloprotease [Actinomycetota bacterium]